MRKNTYKALALFLMAIITISMIPFSKASDSSVFDSVFRLHIIANSDSNADQEVKLKVRDALLRYEKETMSNASDKDEARALLMQNGSEILALTENILRENGMDYGAQLMVGTFYFPTREYNGETYPAGMYEALRIVLGNGSGKNWWCVMFPPLCILEVDDGKIEQRGLSFDSLLLQLIKRIDGGNLWRKIKGK